MKARFLSGTAAAAVIALAGCTPSEGPPPSPSTAGALPAVRGQSSSPERHADFGPEHPGAAARQIADWAIDSGDNRNAPFLVIDKVAARAYAFDRNGRLAGASAVLLGLAKGDDTAPGVGDKPLSQVSVKERTTAAGRFVGELGYNLSGEDVLWVDYDAGLSLHRVLTTHPRERRPQRLATPTPLDNRISYGCINVPASFFENVVRPLYRGTKGMIYVLPESRSLRTVFHAYDVDRPRRAIAASDTLHATAAKASR